MIGRTLSHYRILEKLGAGGMGEVYRARDEKLGRDVALKVLPPGLLSREDARARFRKEALALSRLSHPHIATLLDSDSQDGIDFLVMELVEGETLVEALGAGSLPEKEAVRLGAQLARGLQAAHEHGVIHRDLKPGNLALTADGLLKILDFGLARLDHLVQPGFGAKTASTDTAVGHVAGTPAYMAPEQLLGKPVDVRTDVYGAGACLYEMATGRRPFGSRSAVELTDAVLHETPASPRTVAASVSPGLESVIVKCLDKDPGLRYQTAKELLVDLERLQVAATSGSARQPVALARGRRRRWPWLVGAAVVAAIGAAAWLSRPAPPPRIVDIRRLTRGLEPTHSYPWTLTTDGPRVYFTSIRTGSWGVFQIPVTGGEESQIPLPFSGPIAVYGYSPAESMLLVGTEPDLAGWPLWMVPTAGGAPRRVGDLRASPLPPSASLSPDGRRIAFVDGSANRLVTAGLDGTVAQTIAPLPDSAFEPQWSPDGSRLRMTARGPKGHESELWKWEVTLGSGTARALWEGTGGAWTPDGRFFVFVRTSVSWYTGDLYAATETPVWRRSPPSLTRLTFGPHRFSKPTLSSDGRRILVFGEELRAELVRWEATRQRFVPFLGGESAGMVDASRDGRWLAWVSFPDGILWRSRRDGSDRLQLSTNAVYALYPRWSPDGSRIVYAALGKGDSGLSIHVVPMTGGADAVLARPSAPDHSYWDPCWLPDGRTVLFSNLYDNQPAGIHRVEVDTPRRDLVPGSEDLKYPKCGPQGQVLAMRVGRFGEQVPSTLGYAVLWPGRGVWEPSGLPPSWSNVSWSRDGRFLYGLDLQARQVRRFGLARRTFENVADAAFPLTVWVNVPWFGLDSGDAPLLMADRSTREIYALDWETP